MAYWLLEIFYSLRCHQNYSRLQHSYFFSIESIFHDFWISFSSLFLRIWYLKSISWKKIVFVDPMIPNWVHHRVFRSICDKKHLLSRGSETRYYFSPGMVFGIGWSIWSPKNVLGSIVDDFRWFFKNVLEYLLRSPLWILNFCLRRMVVRNFWLPELLSGPFSAQFMQLLLKCIHINYQSCLFQTIAWRVVKSTRNKCILFISSQAVYFYSYFSIRIK